MQGKGIEIRNPLDLEIGRALVEGPCVGQEAGRLQRPGMRKRATRAVGGGSAERGGAETWMEGHPESERPFHKGSLPTGGVDVETGKVEMRLSGKQSSASE